MSKLLVTLCLFCLFLLTGKQVLAVSTECRDEKGLVFEQNIPATAEFEFVDEHPDLPKVSDFKVMSYYPMSNTCGERWALVTLLNTSPGTSSINEQGLVAVFSDGSKRTAINFKERIAGKARHTQSVYFGLSKFPILKIITRLR